MPFRTAAIVLLAAASLAAQHQPYPVHESRASIIRGPYLLAPTSDSVTIVWTTDKPAHARVLYGTTEQLGQTAEPHEHGLRPIGTLHAVRLRGLQPGVTYHYRPAVTEVVKMKSYWPEKGQETLGPLARFTTLNPHAPTAVFHAVTDTHGDLARIVSLVEQIDWPAQDFLVHLGDALDVESEDAIWDRFLTPFAKAMDGRIPLLFVRGNHDARGPAARALPRHVPPPGGRYYYTRTHGPAHFIVVDTGEDKPDETNVYARLNAFREYKAEQLAWFQEQAKSLPPAPFRILLAHAPNWGWSDGQEAAWTAAANEARIDLSLSGHTHRFSYAAPGENSKNWHQLVLAPDQVARVEVSADQIRVRVTGRAGVEVGEFTIDRRNR